MSEKINIPKEIILELYKTKTKQEIAECFGYSLSVINRIFKEYGIKGNKSKGKAVIINQTIKDVTIGSLLGDGFIENKSLSIAHSLSQKGYLEYKINLIADICNGNMYERKINGEISSYRTRTYFHDYFKELREKWYIPKKTIPSDIEKDLTPLSVAIWYLDDGSLRSKTSARIATCGYSKGEVEFLSKALNNKFHIETKVMKEGKYHTIYIPSKSFKLLREIIKEYVPECMQYKLFKV